MTHADITWKLRPPPETPLLQKLRWSLTGKLLRLQCHLQGVEPPKLFFPAGNRAVLEAYVGEGGAKRKVGRFGILTEAGPSTAELERTVREVYRTDDDAHQAVVRAAAVIYMYVEPDHRGRGIGRLALGAIGRLHAARGCDYTVLVADDKSADQRLVRWYERLGYARAPRLQDAFGSPGGAHGVAMIAPTAAAAAEPDDDCVIEWW